MSLGLSRAALRRIANNQHHLQTIVFRRSQTSAAAQAQQTASSAAQTAKETLGPAATKASEGLSRVASSAGSAVNAVGNALGGIGGRTGRLIGAVQGLIPPTVYYSRVGLELGKIIFESRKMSPPSAQTFQTFFNNALGALRHPSSLLPSLNVSSYFRNIDRKQLAGAGVVLAEVIGFFTIGEMIGRFKIVGYRSSASHEEH